jgi:hypothetical protein
MTALTPNLTNSQRRALRNLPSRWTTLDAAQEKVRTLNALVRAGLAEARGDALSGWQWRRCSNQIKEKL